MKVVYKGILDKKLNFTYDKVYSAEWAWGDPTTQNYFVTDDNGVANVFSMKLFIQLSEYREKRLNKLLNIDES